MGIADAKEEYDKELEDRQISQGEVTLRGRVKKNAERQKKITLTKLSTISGIPEGFLARTRESSPGNISTPNIG
ncbi:hypothetical protein PC116_g22095 [Phytophthora cactorum]|uniref:Uncharacterized protein n=1 Tax=Phytophthora cactorum TaxID=29920 RepID=A0A8T1K2M7_9STRA|nr:hypothetical protein PC111_g20941 [Phytophthora cactorum]KAG2815984.1 hypothetical protein PC112_g13644 [Phytophthora cactorum]KAG2828817.1 hypothetical protein PC113_g21388 [Phytophthora cactorum]KAG2878020.1 hypothetical protein PC114_g23334 [Phytophthora cactorum]KAG2913469.1 hypothetical protein PC117_g18578 [Phytophthora cactorum]